MTLDDGTKIDADKTYVVAGWATVGSQSPGEPIWDTVADLPARPEDRQGRQAQHAQAQERRRQPGDRGLSGAGLTVAGPQAGSRVVLNGAGRSRTIAPRRMP